MQKNTENPGGRPSPARQREPSSERQKGTELITVTDCSLGIRRNLLEMQILLGFGFGILVMSFVVASAAGLYAEPGFTKIISGAVSVPSMIPLKLSWDRFSQARFLRDVQVILEKNSSLSAFAQSELARIFRRGSIKT